VGGVKEGDDLAVAPNIDHSQVRAYVCVCVCVHMQVSGWCQRRKATLQPHPTLITAKCVCVCVYIFVCQFASEWVSSKKETCDRTATQHRLQPSVCVCVCVYACACGRCFVRVSKLYQASRGSTTGCFCVCVRAAHVALLVCIACDGVRVSNFAQVFAGF